MVQPACKSRNRWLRRAFTALALASAVAFAQHAAALHDLGHALEQIGERHPGAPHEPARCAQHGVFAELAAAAPPFVPVAAVLEAGVQSGEPLPGIHARAPRLAFRSRAPPIPSA